MKQTRRLSMLAIAVAAALAAGPASSDIEYQEDIAVNGQGIGAKATVLTVQQSGNNTTQSGCVAWNGSANVIGSGGCPAGFNGGGDESTGNSQTGTRTLGEVGITDYANLAIVLDVNQTGQSPAISLDDMVVRIWLPNGSLCHTAPLVAANKGDLYSGSGVGTAGNVFTLTGSQVTSANGCAGPRADHRVGVAVKMGAGQGGAANNGPETFSLARISSPPNPGTPAIDIEKATNGVDADDPASAPLIPVGATVTWTYVVTNLGTVTLSNVAVTDNQLGPVNCPLSSLAPAGETGSSMTCTAVGTAVEGLYGNIGTASGQGGTTAVITVTDSDPSHYRGVLTPTPIPTMGVFGLGALAAWLGGIGMLAAFRRRT
jgi:hypothetical protein